MDLMVAEYLLNLLAIVLHAGAFWSGVQILRAWEVKMQQQQIGAVFSLSHILGHKSFITRRLWIVTLSTLTSLCYTLKMLDGFAHQQMVSEHTQFFLEWSIMEILTGALIWLYHIDTLRDRREKV